MLYCRGDQLPAIGCRQSQGIQIVGIQLDGVRTQLDAQQQAFESKEGEEGEEEKDEPNDFCRLRGAVAGGHLPIVEL